MPYPIVVIPFIKVEGITLFPFIIIKNERQRTDELLIRHEMIHLRQQAELFVIPFYIAYLINYLINLIRYKNHYQAYRQIVFEREAFVNESDPDYLQNRPFWAWLNDFR